MTVLFHPLQIATTWNLVPFYPVPGSSRVSRQGKGSGSRRMFMRDLVRSVSLVSSGLARVGKIVEARVGGMEVCVLIRRGGGGGGHCFVVLRCMDPGQQKGFAHYCCFAPSALDDG